MIFRLALPPRLAGFEPTRLAGFEVTAEARFWKEQLWKVLQKRCTFEWRASER